MSKYPAINVGIEVTADLLNSMLIDTYLKAATTTITSNTTLANDNELANIALGVGDYEIDVLLYADGADGDFKVAWAFSGSLAATPNRSCEGPGSSNTGTPSNLTHQYRNLVAYNSAVSYFFTGASTYNMREECTLFEVSAAGNFAIQVAQNTSNANATTVRAGSRVRIRQIG
jgi:hypothetical protein